MKNIPKRKSKSSFACGPVSLFLFISVIVSTIAIRATPFVVVQTGTGQANESQTTQTPKGWSRTGGHRENYFLTTDNKERHGGRASATLISKNVASDEGYGSMKQEIRADDYRGKRLRYSGFLKTEILDKHAALWMRVEGEGGKILTFDNMESRAIKGTTKWKKYEIVLDVPVEAQHIALGALFEGKGQIWVDDLKLEVVGQDVASTDMNASPEVKQEMDEEDKEYRLTHKEEFDKAVRQAKERLQTMPTRPVNFDFER